MKITALDKWICRKEGVPELTRGILEDLMLRKLNSLLLREKIRGGFYAGLPEKLSSLEDISRLPFTTEENLRGHISEISLMSQSEVCRVITDATSGTAGCEKRVFYTAGDCGNTVGFFAAGLSELVSSGDSVLITMPYSGPYGLGDLISKAVVSLGARPVKGDAARSFEELHEIIRRSRPAVYVGMPVTLLSVLRLYGRCSLRRALISGDACPVRVTDDIESRLGSKLFPHYGSREICLGGAVTCPAHSGMHIRENDIIAEVVSAGGAVLPDGETGELVVTTIGMEAMPLIRYRTGDICRIVPGVCECGGVTRRIARISRSGSIMEDFDNAVFSFPGVIDYSAEESGGRLVFDILGTADEEEIRSALAGPARPHRAEIRIRPAAPEDGPSYAGKRRILRCTQ